MATQPTRAAARGPWGPVATLALSVLAGALFFLAQLAVAVPYLVVRLAGDDGPDADAVAASLERDGLLFALTQVVAAPITIGFLVFLAWIRKGPSVVDYLALSPPPPATTLRWLLLIGLLVVVLDGASVAAGFPVVPDWVRAVYRSAVSVPLLVFAMVVLAPALEELLFRGFLFEGLHRSPLGTWGTVVLTSALWSVLHLQYEWFYLGHIFAMGLALGAARARTGSLVPPLLMHTLANAIASLQMVLDSVLGAR